MRLVKAVTKAVDDPADPAAVLALAYAVAIDRATHVPATLADALETLRRAAVAADVADDTTDAGAAYRRVAGALAVTTVLDKLGPKLLTALDTLLVTPKAIVAITGRLTPPATEPAGDVDPLDELRDRRGTRSARAAG